MPTPAEIAALTSRLAGDVSHVARVTPLEELGYLSTPTKRILAKREDLQTTGSFKIRGATAKLATLDADQLGAGIVAASTGNHGLAVAHAARRVGAEVAVYVPANASSTKLAKIEAEGGTVVPIEGNAILAERRAREDADRSGRVYVSPYNDPAVIAGQGTIGLELADQMAGSFTLVVSVGGGGLVAGAAAYLSQRDVTVVGTSPEVDAAMATSVRMGRVVDVDALPTLSDGTAGNLEHDTVTFGLVRELVDRWVLQSEQAIATADALHRAEAGYVVEGSASLALATAAALDVEGDVVVVLCGGNV